LGWNAGDTLWLRWVERNDAGNDHGLAIDNFELATGIVEPPLNNADFDNDEDIDGADFLIWQRGLGSVDQLDKSTGDATGDGSVDAADLDSWVANFGGGAESPFVASVPEPTTLALAVLAALGVCRAPRRR
jgi:hypothetical protein